MSEIVEYLEKVVKHQHLTEAEAGRAFQIIMAGGATPAHIAALLIAMRMNGETVEEITGAAKAVRAKATKIQVPAEIQDHILDTCGTGGDGAKTFNISTAVAFVVAACGVPVAKHGNRSVSSRSGSADVLTALGINIKVEPSVMEEALQDCGICFLMAPKYHSAMRHVAPVRQELELRTMFNILGPLTNPAGAKRQLIGVYDQKWVRPLAEVLQALGSKRAMVVHGSDGLDEITTTSITHAAELKDGVVREFTINPEEFAIPLAIPKDLKGGSPEENAVAMRATLKGKAGAYRDIVLINAAAALMVADKANDFADGITMAKQAIDSGDALKKLEALVTVTNA